MARNNINRRDGGFGHARLSDPDAAGPFELAYGATPFETRDALRGLAAGLGNPSLSNIDSLEEELASLFDVGGDTPFRNGWV